MLKKSSGTATAPNKKPSEPLRRFLRWARHRTPEQPATWNGIWGVWERSNDKTTCAVAGLPVTAAAKNLAGGKPTPEAITAIDGMATELSDFVARLGGQTELNGQAD